MKAAVLRDGCRKATKLPDLSNADAMLVAIPMIGVLVVGFFRLDELVGKPRKVGAPLDQSIGRDADGQPVSLDPDGTVQPARRIKPRKK